jgi:hypothetical protein
MSHNPVMLVHRITRIAEVVRHWPFFVEGIKYEAKYLRYAHPIEVYRRILFHLVYKNPNAWVGVAFHDSDGDLTPVGFIMSHDTTPLFARYREFEVSMFYYRPGYRTALPLLQSRLDDFCRENGVRRYYLTTSSFCRSATRVFGDAWSGLVKSNTVFKRNLSP